MKKHISASASSSSLLDSVSNLLSKLLNKFIDSLFSDDNYDKKTDDKVSDDVKKEAEKARKKYGNKSKNKQSSDETDKQTEEIPMSVERITVTPKSGAENADDLDEFEISKVQWGDTKDIFITVKNKRTGKTKADYLNNPSESQIKTAIENLKSEVTASKRIKVSLNRIVGESEDTIDITAIQCSYNVGSAYTDIRAVLDDDEFIDTVPEGESAYEILPTDDDYVVDEYDGEVDSGDIYAGAFDCATAFYSCIFYLCINRTYGNTDFMSFIESLKYSTQYQMETLAKWTKMHTPSKEVTLCYCTDCCDTECPDRWTILETALADYRNCLEALYSCAAHEEQSVIDGWLLDIDYAQYRVHGAME